MKRFIVSITEETQTQHPMQGGLSLVGDTIISTSYQIEVSNPEEAVRKLADYLNVPIMVIPNQMGSGAV